MFYGEFNNTVDLKGRASIPSTFRETLLSLTGDVSLVVTKTDKGLTAYPASSWKKISQKVMALPEGPIKQANLRTRLGPAKECPFDKQGRIQIPQALREYAGLEKDIVVVGMGGKIEIWNQQRHAEATSASESMLKDHAQAQADLGF
ncbi:division/cell wall cluster transcriptional repressor MraZ [Geopsychrobacter electrodiphilus]|uniref:division/cell wall cluster transcriptional repressor MraZ n=1 Tax=Geopsychrobacter electrodiphilus TaxID=225196 RepID=UPI00036A77FB|nr:division/cell wall cluster transcriptional repressor MraZ [Geopsychrobacter electrodiphilus]